MHHKDLDVWKLSMELVLEVYKITQKFPKEEIYGLVSQMRRSAVSIPSNIAEGAGRQSIKQYKLFLSYSKGSAVELETQLLISRSLDFLNEDELATIQSKISRIIKMISSMFRS